MKKLILLLLIVLAFTSCSPLDDNTTKHYLDVLPVESFIVPETFDMNATYDIKITYKRPSDCYVYDAIYYQKQGDIRVFGIQAIVTDDGECQPITEEPIEVNEVFVSGYFPSIERSATSVGSSDSESGRLLIERPDSPNGCAIASVIEFFFKTSTIAPVSGRPFV